MQLTTLIGMERKSFAGMGCSIAQCLEVVGDSWTMLIVRDAFNGVTRFDEFRDHLGMPRNTLRDRLAKLVESGVLAKVPYSDHPPRHDYVLTDAGRDLWPVLTAMRQWGDWHGSPDGPIRMAHADCGAPTETVVVCGSCGDRLGPDDVEMAPKASVARRQALSPAPRAPRVRAGQPGVTSPVS
jgi:DNA-binding HxlR family transcriptional regulator